MNWLLNITLSNALIAAALAFGGTPGGGGHLPKPTPVSFLYPPRDKAHGGVLSPVRQLGSFDHKDLVLGIKEAEWKLGVHGECGMWNVADSLRELAGLGFDVW